jgi:cytochrome c553
MFSFVTAFRLSVLVLLALVAVPAPGGTQDTDRLHPSLQDGDRLQEQVKLCSACHGEKGIPQEKTTPIIWGQHQGYLYLQLRDFKNGDRKNEQMGPVAEPLERADMLALAEYFSKKAWPRTVQPPAKDDVALTAARANTAVGCTGCHQNQYRGEGTQARLAGQTREYLFKTMLEIRTGARGNNPGMTTLMKATNEEDIAALAEYLAGLRL